MPAGLMLSLIGLALLDSVNVSTIWAVVIILLLAQKPLRTGWAFAAGAIISFTTFTVLLYLGAGMAEQFVADITLWFRRVLLVGVTLFRLSRSAVAENPATPGFSSSPDPGY